MITDIQQLINACEQELHDREYHAHHADFITNEWKGISQWCQKKNYTEFSQDIGFQYCDEMIGAHIITKGMTHKQKLQLRAARMLVSYQKDGDFEFRSPRVERIYKGETGRLILQFFQHERNIGRSEKTLECRDIYLYPFNQFLLEHDLDFSCLDIDTIEEYFTSMGYELSCRHNSANHLRQLFHYLYDNGYTATDGLRDYVILMILYTTGIRVSELINIRVRDLSLHEPYTLLVHGKGRKSRYVPLLKDSIPIIQDYLKYMKYTKPEKMDEWLFVNHMNSQFTRQGINYILSKYGDIARENAPDLIPADLSPHKMRHTAAMELVDSGVDLIYIRDLLGHVSIKTTEIYAKADAKLKRAAIEAASKEIVPPEEAQWDSNDDLKSWLKTFSKR